MKLNGGIIGAANQPTNRVASGVWSRHEQYTNVLYNSFPAYFPGFDLTTLQNAQTVYENVFLSVSAQDGLPNDIFFKPDGTRMFMIGRTNNTVYQYNLATPWNVTTAAFAVSRVVSALETGSSGLAFSTDGTKMYICGITSDSVYQFSLPSAWDLLSSTYDSVSLAVAGQTGTPNAIHFRPDGLMLFVAGPDRVYQYNLSSAWNLSTATYANVSFSTLPQSPSAAALTFKPDGTKMFVGDNNNSTVYEYNLSSPWDIATATYSFNNYKTAISTSAGFAGDIPLGIAFDSAGTRLYTVGSGQDRVFQFEVGTPYTLLMTPGYAGSVSIIAQENGPREVSFSLDGTNMYVVGTANDTVYQYSLSAAWDVTTAVYAAKSLSVITGTSEGTPTGLFFKPDGTKMYMIGTGIDTIFQFGLATPWDISTGSYDGISRLVSAQSGTPNALFFGNNGLKLYVLNATGQVYQYALSTAWDLSTVTYENKSFDMRTSSYTNAETAFEGFFFSADGSTMFGLGTNTGRVYQYSLAVNWDISTTTYAAKTNYSYINYDLTKPQLGDTGGIYFKPDGTKMFIIGSMTDRVHQYFLTP
jgi:sugar lactone lactonase YvrE